MGWQHVGWYVHASVCVRRRAKHAHARAVEHAHAGNGGLGHGDDTSQLAPALVESFVHDGIKLKAVAVGTSHMLGLSTEGTVFSWGNCEYGRCGNGKSKQKSPQVVDLLADKKVVAVAAGYTHSLALDADGYVWVWGKNHAGQLGVGGTVLFDLNTMEEYPMKIELEGDDAHRFST
ncbi:hypothetical protein EON67_09550 [archaeon]|nr:MAG: hypothetical protein EON67_09550 [archaeon]